MRKSEDRRFPFVSGSTFGSGKGGSVRLVANVISVTDGFINSFTAGDGKGGTVTLTAGTITLAGETQVAGGKITLTADTITVTGKGSIDSATRSNGQGGTGVAQRFLQKRP